MAVHLRAARESHRLSVTSGGASKELRDACEERDIQLLTGDELIEWIVRTMPKLKLETKRKLCVSEVPTYLE